MRASFALKDSHCRRSYIIDYTENEQLMYISVYIYILMVTVRNGMHRRRRPSTSSSRGAQPYSRDFRWREKLNLDVKL